MKWLYIGAGIWLLAEVVQRVFTPKRAARNIADMGQKLYSGPHEYAAVRPADFPGLDPAYYDRMQVELEGLGFRCLGDVENLTLSRVLPSMRTFLRRFTGEQGTITAAIYQVKYRGWMGLLALCGVLSRRPYYVDFETEFADGTFLCTTNTGDTNKSGAVAGITHLRRAQSTSARDLLTIHRQKLSELAQKSAPRCVENAEEYQAAQDRMQELKNRQRRTQGFVDMDQVRASAEKHGSAETNAALLKELAAIQRERGAATTSVPPPLPQVTATGTASTR